MAEISDLIKYMQSDSMARRKEEKEAIDNAQKGNSSTSAKMGDPVPDHIKNSFKKASYATQKSKK